MSRYYYDLHIHSCLSPCGDGDATPGNIAGMGALAGLQMMALTDHNTCRNCPAFFALAPRYGILPVAGMELTTAEDIHMVCLFATLEGALAFDRLVDARRVRVPNRPDIFGEQLLVDEEDRVVGCEPDLLTNATAISLEEVPGLAASCGGIGYPAHIDRPSNSVTAVLGCLPATPVFPCVELADGANEPDYRQRYLTPATRVVVSSDAHYLWHIRDKEHYIELPDGAADDDTVRRQLIAALRGDGQR